MLRFVLPILQFVAASANLDRTIPSDVEECDLKQVFDHRRKGLAELWRISTEVDSNVLNKALDELEKQLEDFMNLIGTDEYREMRRYMADNWKGYMTVNVVQYLSYFKRLSVLSYFLNLVKEIYLAGEPEPTNQEEHWKVFKEYLLTAIDDLKAGKSLNKPFRIYLLICCTPLYIEPYTVGAVKSEMIFLLSS
ncbi:uncharacterized protein LOC106671952 isoform X2 [Cimex lectularius]|uniref:Uncharacterized protein n=1 Tax=Cimex lectularius TaxID=79782 RepID=A0A8I6TKF8_CIMLE|nr:uncharacterized protein LOC106671952 isoform X2 [Cimex lectularius]